MGKGGRNVWSMAEEDSSSKTIIQVLKWSPKIGAVVEIRNLEISFMSFITFYSPDIKTTGILIGYPSRTRIK